MSTFGQCVVLFYCFRQAVPVLVDEQLSTLVSYLLAFGFDVFILVFRGLPSSSFSWSRSTCCLTILKDLLFPSSVQRPSILSRVIVGSPPFNDVLLIFDGMFGLD